MEKLNKAIEKINKDKDLKDEEKAVITEHLKEWYNEKKSIAALEEKIEEWWDKVLPYLDESGLI